MRRTSVRWYGGYLLCALLILAPSFPPVAPATATVVRELATGSTIAAEEGIATEGNEEKLARGISRRSVSSGGGGWTQLPLYGGSVLCLVVTPSNPQILYIGTLGGVFKSSDSGASWGASSSGLANSNVYCLAIDPSNFQTLYAGTWGGGVCKSIDGGVNWSASSSGLANSSVWSLTIDPSDPQILYASTLGGIWKSSDGGTNWTASSSGLINSNVYCLAIDPSNPQILYAGIINDGIWKSSDGGASWTTSSSGLTNNIVWCLAIDSSNSQTLYAGTYGSGIFKSSDGGGSWTASSSGLTNSSMRRLAIDPSNSQTLYTGTLGGGVFKSSNGGTNWTASSSGLINSNVYCLAIDPSNSQTLYVGTQYGGVWKSNNVGGNWAASSGGLRNSYVYCLVINRSNPQTLYAGTLGSGVFKSSDGGANWTISSSGLTNNDVYCLAIDPTNSQILYAGTQYGGVWKSSDGGANWAASTIGLTKRYVWCLSIDPNNPQTLYASTNGGVFKSNDAGGSWTTSSTGVTNNSVYYLAIDRNNSQTLYAGTGGGIFKSSDAGESWTTSSTGLANSLVYCLAMDPTNSKTLYAGAVNGGGVWKSSDGGGSWNITGLTNSSVQCLAMDPTNSQTLYAGTNSGGVFKSSDGGESWTTSSNGLTNSNVRCLAIDPNNPQTLYAGTYGGGLWKSTSGGSLPLILLSPNGGEKWPISTTQTITWTSTGFSGDIIIELSRNGGLTWQMLTTSTGNSVSYSWTPTGLASTTCQIRIGSVKQPSIFDQSDLNFALANPGESQSFITLDGSPWDWIDLGIPPIATDPPGDSRRGGIGSDLADFYVAKERNANDLLLLLTTYNPPASNHGFFHFHISTNGDYGYGNTDYLLDVNVSGKIRLTRYNDGSPVESADLMGVIGEAVEVHLPLDAIGNPSDLYIAPVAPAPDVCDDDFLYQDGHLVVASLPSASYPSLTLLSPNGGESWGIGEEQDITWTSSNLSTLVQVELSRDNSVTWTTLATDQTSSGAYNWTAIGPTTQTARIRVTTTGCSDTSDQPFSITGPSITLSSPNGREFWQRGSAQQITWTSSGLSGNVKIEISRYCGQYWESIVNSTTNSGSFTWTPTGILSSACQIRISSTIDPTITDNSDANFDIWDFNQWESLAEGLDEGDFSSISISPYDSNLLFAGKLNEGGAYRSINGGTLWTPITQGLDTENVFGFAFAPSGSPTIYAAAGAVLWQSFDQGTTWMNGNFFFGGYTHAVVAPYGSVVLVGAENSGVWRSTDGVNWNQVALAGYTPGSFAVDPSNPAIIYVSYGGFWANASPGGVYRTLDGGETWSPISDGLTNADVRCLAITPSAVYAATSDRWVFRLPPGETQWVQTNTTAVPGRAQVIAAHPLDPGVVYASSFLEPSGIYKSNDGGENWAPIDEGLANRAVTAIAIDPNQPSSLFVSPFSAGIFQSQNGGATWTPRCAGTGITFFNIATPAQDPNTFFASYNSASNRVIKSEDGGMNWLPRSNGLIVAPGVLTRHPTAPQTMYAGCPFGVWKTENGGENWTGMSDGLPLDYFHGGPHGIQSIVADSRDGRILYAGTATGVYVYDPQTNYWGERNEGISGSRFVNSIVVDPLDPDILYIGTSILGNSVTTPVWKSIDGGFHWTPASEGIPPTWAQTLAIDPSNPLVLYAGTGSGIYKTIDGGRTWSSIGGEDINYPYIDFIAIHPQNSFIIYAGVRGSKGVYRSLDGGQSWESINEGLLSRRFYWMGIDTNNPGYLFACTQRGLFRYISPSLFFSDLQLYLPVEAGSSVGVVLGGDMNNPVAQNGGITQTVRGRLQLVNLDPSLISSAQYEDPDSPGTWLTLTPTPDGAGGSALWMDTGYSLLPGQSKPCRFRLSVSASAPVRMHRTVLSLLDCSVSSTTTPWILAAKTGQLSVVEESAPALSGTVSLPQTGVQIGVTVSGTGWGGVYDGQPSGTSTPLGSVLKYLDVCFTPEGEASGTATVMVDLDQNAYYASCDLRYWDGSQWRKADPQWLDQDKHQVIGHIPYIYLRGTPLSVATPEGLSLGFALQGATSYTATFAVSFYEPGGTSPLFSNTVTIPAQAGSFTLTGVTAGTYDIKIKEGRALSSRKSGVEVSGSISVSFGTQPVGDANGDDVVNILDFALLKASFGKTTGQGSFDGRADFDGNGVINITDFSYLKSNFGRWGGCEEGISGD